MFMSIVRFPEWAFLLFINHPIIRSTKSTLLEASLNKAKINKSTILLASTENYVGISCFTHACIELQLQSLTYINSRGHQVWGRHESNASIFSQKM
jgi:hypothetical protein